MFPIHKPRPSFQLSLHILGQRFLFWFLPVSSIYRTETFPHFCHCTCYLQCINTDIYIQTSWLLSLCPAYKTNQDLFWEALLLFHILVCLYAQTSIFKLRTTWLSPILLAKPLFSDLCDSLPLMNPEVLIFSHLAPVSHDIGSVPLILHVCLYGGHIRAYWVVQGVV